MLNGNLHQFHMRRDIQLPFHDGDRVRDCSVADLQRVGDLVESPPASEKLQYINVSRG
jgi:hypothetical protein